MHVTEAPPASNINLIKYPNVAGRCFYSGPSDTKTVQFDVS